MDIQSKLFTYLIIYYIILFYHFHVNKSIIFFEIFLSQKIYIHWSRLKNQNSKCVIIITITIIIVDQR